MISFYLKQKKTLKPKTTLKIIQCKRNKIAVLSHPVVFDSLQPHGLSPPDSSVYGIFQARILEWVAISYSRGSSWPRDQTISLGSPALAGRFFTVNATYFKEIVSFISDGPVLYPRSKIYHIYIYIYIYIYISLEKGKATPCSVLAWRIPWLEEPGKGL